MVALKHALRVLFLVIPQLFVVGKMVSFAHTTNRYENKKDLLTITANENLEIELIEELEINRNPESDNPGYITAFFSYNPQILSLYQRKSSCFCHSVAVLRRNPKLYLLFSDLKIPFV